MHPNTTPVPNILFDVHLNALHLAELKVLLVIIRQTLGWKDRRALLGRKEIDWISNVQLQSKTGSSRRAISTAIESLVSKKLIEVFDDRGNLLNDPEKRKGKLRLYFKLSSAFQGAGENPGKTCVYPADSGSTCANTALDIRKKVTALAQKMHITKETLQN